MCLDPVLERWQSFLFQSLSVLCQIAEHFPASCLTRSLFHMTSGRMLLATPLSIYSSILLSFNPSFLPRPSLQSTSIFSYLPPIHRCLPPSVIFLLPSTISSSLPPAFSLSQSLHLFPRSNHSSSLPLYPSTFSLLLSIFSLPLSIHPLPPSIHPSSLPFYLSTFSLLLSIFSLPLSIHLFPPSIHPSSPPFYPSTFSLLLSIFSLPLSIHLLPPSIYPSSPSIPLSL